MGSEPSSPFKPGSVKDWAICEIDKDCSKEGMRCCSASKNPYPTVKLCGFPYYKYVPTGTVDYGGFEYTCEPLDSEWFIRLIKGDLYGPDGKFKTDDAYSLNLKQVGLISLIY